jgi:hypothetical protein
MDSCWCECCNVEGWIDHWSADFSWVWWASTTRYATTVYCTEASKCYTTKASDYNTTVYVDPSYYAEAPKYFSSPNFHYLHHAASLLNNNVNTFLLYEGLQVLRHKGSWVLNSNLRCSKNYNNAMYCSVTSYYTEDWTCYTTEVFKYFSTTYVAPAYITKSTDYYTTKALE